MHDVAAKVVKRNSYQKYHQLRPPHNNWTRRVINHR